MSLNPNAEFWNALQAIATLLAAVFAAVGTLCTVVFGSIGLVVVVLELRSLSKSIKGSSSSQAYTYMFALLNMQIEHPELRRYVYSGQYAPEGGIEADRAAAFFGAFNDFIEFVYAQRRLGILPENEFRDTWEGFFSKLYTKSPGLRAYVLQNPEFYAPEIVRIVGSIEDKAKAEKP